jgi:D-alanyl-D-alanine carboxypeptidase
MMQKIALSLILLLSGCSQYLQDLSISECEDASPVNEHYSKGPKLESTLQDLVAAGVPGVSLALYSESEGWWASSAGLAKIEEGIPMETCHLQYLQSVAKTYLAVAILRLYERGEIDLDRPITEYLPGSIIAAINDSRKITVRMLLNHTSGIPEYNFDPQYVSYLLQHPDHKFKPEDYIGYIAGKPLDFEPGSQYSYRNINYVLLALMADKITGDHARLIEETVFKPLRLNQTYYRNDEDYLTHPTLVNSYWDRYSDGVIENVSRMQRNNVETLVGDDGIVATPVEAVRFLKGLVEGELINSETFAQMQSWVPGKDGKPRYGLGLAYSEINGYASFGHSGGGIGAGCELHYFPEKKLYMFIAINLGTVTGSPIHDRVTTVLDSLYNVLLR